MSRLAFAKHFAIAGQGYAPKPQKLMRAIAMFLHYSSYLQKREFQNNRFSLPPIQLSDPTEKGQFSNLAGKAIADFLSKRIDKSIFTINYEAAMRMKEMPLNVGRPDLIAFRQNSTDSNAMFAIEAKGFQKSSSGDMSVHKAQSKTGGIAVNFTVACVSYNLYNKVKCKYHDPFNDNISYDLDLVTKLTKNYYAGLLGFLNNRFFEYSEIDYNGEKFYAVRLRHRYFEEILQESLLRNFWWHEFYDFSPSLILPGNINDLAKEGIWKGTIPFSFETNSENSYIYIDNDRIGLSLRRW
ncbi:hypothetical protein [Flavobacterium sp. C4GT6]|uniref:hypothetical protein n=1 Tax=Flavobacterium sp. C4GT6 TaxID=3103818 RepID=UPI002ED5F87A